MNYTEAVVQKFERLRARLAAVEAERDAAQAGEARAVEALDVFARAYRVSMLPFAPGIDEADGAHHWMPHGWPSVADFKLANSVLSDSSALSWLAQQRAEAARIERQLQAMLMQHRHDIRDLGQLLQDERCKVATIEAAWYAARAGEARAVEAIKGLLNQLHEFDFEIDGSVEFFDSVQQCRDATDNTQPALDWLAQREREAAARELRLLADGCATVNPVLSWQLRACADGLTDQQPTACSRSEVRGKERL